MSRVTWREWLLIALLLPAGLLALGEAIRVGHKSGGLRPGFAVWSASGPTSYPTVMGIDPEVFASSPLVLGDRIVRVGERDQAGASALGVYAATLEVSGSGRNLPLTVERGDDRLALHVPRHPTYYGWWHSLPFSFVIVATALFLLIRAPQWHLARRFFVASVAMAAAFPASLSEQGLASKLLGVAFLLGQPFALLLTLKNAAEFTKEARPIPAWLHVGAFAFAAISLGCLTSRFFLYLPAQAHHLNAVSETSDGLFAIALLLALLRAYRRSTVQGRRQIRWVLYGFYPVCLGIFLGNLSHAFGGTPAIASAITNATFIALLGIPLGLWVAVTAYGYLDIDRLLSATASYNILLALLAAAALILVPRVAEITAGLVGVAPGTSQVILSIALASLVIPAHHRLRPQIDRVFFKERYALDYGIAELLPTLSTSNDAGELTERTGEALVRLFRPGACVIYAPAGGSFAPLFVKGRAVPPAFGPASPLVSSLADRRAPLSFSTTGRRPDEAALGPFDRAALQTLQAEIVVPIRQDDALVAFLCLGPKRSGDVYTSTDLSLLTAVAETVSARLARLDEEDTTRQARQMQDALRRYVPGAVAEQLSAGGDLAAGEREVSILFVDIRGYTSLSESRRAEEIFSTVNRYTETVSRIVQKHGGSVVEFNGDGMMAVFGAPRELAYKERAAVEAGREIVEAVSALPVERAETKLSVGVGIATGEAFVGNIQAVDRMIWSAIGNTTNLAARLQALTRDLEASVVIDRSTWERAQLAAEGFELRPEVEIRGRRETQDVYAL